MNGMTKAGSNAGKVLPPMVAQLMGMLPAYPGSLLFVTALNVAIAKHMPQDVRQSLSGKKLRIRVKDAGVEFDFEWREQRFAACRKGDGSDLTIAANGHDFVLLAQRQEDPDTLFFSRRLSMEGDTELGLMVKNTLDAIDLSAFNLKRLVRARLESIFRV
nr:SCP2 sterol-binding domain-containing protein [Herbaspirillum sp. RV1423]